MSCSLLDTPRERLRPKRNPPKKQPQGEKSKNVDKSASIQPLILALALLATSCNSNSNKGSVSGTIETDEARLASRYGGRVEKILADEGDTLKSGMVIVELEAGELRAKRDQMAAQLAELEAGPRKEEIEAA